MMVWLSAGVMPRRATRELLWSALPILLSASDRSWRPGQLFRTLSITAFQQVSEKLLAISIVMARGIRVYFRRESRQLLQARRNTYLTMYRLPPLAQICSA